MAATKLTDIMKERQTLSFELYPPKTEKGMLKLPDIIAHLCDFQPDYISCTYGAGGGNVGANRQVCQMVRNAGSVPVTGVDHILALRGDIPRGETTTCGDFNYATDLVKFIRDSYGDRFEIAVAGSPEGHIACRSLEADVAVLKMKQDNGADYIMTQLCWDMEQFKRWLDMIRKAGVTLPINVGIMPVLDMKATINVALSRNGCVIERELARLISKYWIFPDPFDSNPPFRDDERERKLADFRKAGIEYTIKQIEAYRACGINGIHLYAMNKWEAVTEIIHATGLNAQI